MRLFFSIVTATMIGVPFFVFATGSGDVIFTEIAYDLKGADDGHEWVEIRNTTAGAIDLTGWKFNDGSNHVLNVPPKNGGQGTMVIPAGGYAVLAGDAEVFLADHPGFFGTVIDTVMSLGNTGATLTIIDADGVTIDTAIYSKETGAAGNGMTLARSSSGGWGESATEGGTPGTENSASTASQQQSETATTTSSVLETRAPASVQQIVPDAGENVVALAGDEIMFDGSGTKEGGGASFVWNFGDGTVAQGETIFHRYLFPGKYIVVLSVAGAEDTIEANIYPRGVVISEFMPDGGAGENEWVEIRNDSAYSADLSGWGIGTGEKKASFIVPEGTMLAAGGYLVFAKEVSRIALSNEKGVITLWYPHGEQAMRVEYDRAKKGFSAARKDNGSYAWTDQRTPGARNVFIISSDGKAFLPPVSAVHEEDAGTAGMRAAWERVHNDGGSAVKSFIAQPAHAMVYDEGSSSLFTPQGTAASAFAYGAFPLSVLAALLGMAGGALGAFIMRKKK